YDLEVEEAVLTGESLSVRKISEAISEEKFSLGERINMVYSGTFVVSGSGKFVVTEIGDNTEMGSISKSIQADYNVLTPLQKELGHLGKMIAVVGISIAIIVFALKIFNYYVHNSLTIATFAESLTISLVLIVSTIPEGLSTMVAATLALAVIKLSKENALVKKLTACESIGAIDVICSDKTGTITENSMKVALESSIDHEEVFENIFYNNSSSQKQEKNEMKKYIGNPTEVALLNYLSDTKKFKTKNEKILFQYSFNSVKKSMSTVVKGIGINILYKKGAPERILEKSILTVEEKKIEIRKMAEEQKKGRRVIAFGHRNLKKKYFWEDAQDELEEELIYDGFISISDPIRKEVYSAVKKCEKAGIEIKILTGDNILTAKTVANELGLLKDKSLVLEAKDIDLMSDYELKGKIDDIAVIARSNPMTKLRVVNLLMDIGKSVAVTGDGINDAPSLKRAEVGIAMGITGTEVSKETADIILLNDSFATIVKAIEEGRGLYENFQKFIQFQQTVNVAALFLILIFEIFDWGTPLRPIQILWVNIMMDGPLAVSLSFETTRKKIMGELPRDKKKSILTVDIWINVLGNAMFMVLFMIFSIRYLEVSKEYIPTYIFNLFVFMVVFNVFNCKEIGRESILKRIFDNKYLNIVFIGTVIIQFFVTTLLTKLFSVNVLPPLEYLKIVGFSLFILIFSEVVRFFRRFLKREDILN
ncbi:MAG: cation-translocating P-type ATPase, partial [Fusobacteriaceae bacterium]